MSMPYLPIDSMTQTSSKEIMNISHAGTAIVPLATCTAVPPKCTVCNLRAPSSSCPTRVSIRILLSLPISTPCVISKATACALELCKLR